MKEGNNRMSKWKKWSKKTLLPSLGLAIMASAFPVSLTSAAPASSGITVVSSEFVGMPAPATTRQMAELYTMASLKVTYSDGSVKIFPLSYKKLFRSTDSVGGTIAGVSVDASGKPIMDTSVLNNPVPFVSEDPDANSLFSVLGAMPTGKGGNTLSLITHYEYINRNNAGDSAYGIIPASMGLTTIDQNKKTGDLVPVALSKIDFSDVGGLWIPCNGSLTPWGTHLGSEEYEPDARAFEADPAKTYTGPFIQAYYNDTAKKGSPYDYGYLPEVTVHADNTTSVVKHYSMGRFSHELGKVAPDMRTVLFGDDGGNTMLFLYVADKAQDLSAGTLYAAKWIQKSAENGGSADLQWIQLGHSTDAEINSYLDKGIKFSEIFDSSVKATTGFTAIKSYPSGQVEYLKVKPGMEKVAAFLESRRYGAIVGATSEFNKMEGVTVNAKDNKAYIAMSYVEKAMEKDAKGVEPADHIQVNKISSGVTYELTMSGGQKDSSGAAISSAYTPSFMRGLIWGEDLAKPDAKGNKAAEDKVANPDNVSFSESLRTLFIGEDSGMHVNNFVWAYNVDTHQLSRVLSTPAGAEATGLTAVDNLNGFSYIMSNIQHPGDEMIVAEGMKSEVEALINQNFDNKKSGVVGYISGLPTEAQMLAAKTEEAKPIALRSHAEASGATVTWHSNNKEAVVTKGSHSIKFILGNKTVTMDGTQVTLPFAPEIRKGSVWVPYGVLNDFLVNNQ
jgi:secreted PhoX family phosphatase